MELSSVFVSLLLFLSLASAQVKWSRNGFPNPRIDIDECGRSRNVSYVCDPQNLLSKIEANQLDRLIESVMDSTTCPCSQTICDKHARGYKIGIAVVEKMAFDDGDQDEQSQNSLARPLNEAWKFSKTLLSRWSLGECEEDLIIFYSKNDQVLYTATGDITEKVLSPSLVGEILGEHMVKFGDKKYFEGFRDVISDYRSVLKKQYQQKTGVPQAPQYLAVIASTATFVPASVMMSVIMAVFVALLH